MGGDRWKSNKKYVYAFVATIVADMINVTIINSVTGGWNPFQSFADMEYESGDVLLFCFLRIVMVIPGVLLAVSFGDFEKYIRREIQVRKDSGSDLETTWNQERKEKQKKTEATKGKERVNPGEEEDVSLVDEEDDPQTKHDEYDISEEDKNKIKSRCAMRRNVVLALLFLFLTLCEVELGVKSVLIQSPTPKTVGSLLIIEIFIINVELYLVREIIAAFTRDEGYWIPGVHHHPLYYQDRLGHWCDICRQRMRKAYFCPDCDYDLCESCFKKSVKNVLNMSYVVTKEPEMTLKFPTGITLRSLITFYNLIFASLPWLLSF